MQITVIGHGDFLMEEQHTYEEEHGESAEIHYHVYPDGSLSPPDLNALEEAVFSAVKTNAPATWRGLYKGGLSLVKRLTETSWILSVGYKKYEGKSRSPLPDYNRAIENWDFSGATKTITQAIKIKSSYGPGGVAPNRMGLIGYDGEKVNGVQIEYAVAHMSLRFLKRAADMTGAYKRDLFSLFNTVNDASWRDFNDGILLFKGGSLAEREDGDYDINLNFSPDIERRFQDFSAFLPDATIVVPPHHYLDCVYADCEITITDAVDTIPQAKYAYVYQVYEEADFSLLQVPGTT